MTALTMKLLLYLLPLLLLFTACQSIDRSYDHIAPMPDSTNNLLAKQIDFMDEVIDDEPEVADYYYKRALLHLNNQNQDKALEDIKKAIRLDNSQANYFFLLAQVLTAKKQLPAALEAAKQAEAKGFKQETLFSLLGKLYYHNKQPIEAVEYLVRAQKIYPENPELFYYRGIISADVQDTANANYLLNKALAYRPDYREAYQSLIDLYLHAGAEQKALDYVYQATQQPGLQEHADFYRLYGDVLSRLKKNKEAINWYEKAIEADSTLWKLSYQIGQHYLSEEKYELARKYLQKTVAVNPQAQGACYKLAIVYDYHLKDPETARRYYEMALSLDPGNQVIQENIKQADKKIAYQEYKRSPQYLVDQLRKRKLEEEKAKQLLEAPASPSQN